MLKDERIGSDVKTEVIVRKEIKERYMDFLQLE